MRVVTAAGLNPERDFRPYLNPFLDAEWERLNQAWKRVNRGLGPTPASNAELDQSESGGVGE